VSFDVAGAGPSAVGPTPVSAPLHFNDALWTVTTRTFAFSRTVSGAPLARVCAVRAADDD